MKVYPFLSTSDLNLFEGLYISNLLSQILDFIIIIYYLLLLSLLYYNFWLRDGENQQFKG